MKPIKFVIAKNYTVELWPYNGKSPFFVLTCNLSTQKTKTIYCNAKNCNDIFWEEVDRIEMYTK